MFTFHPNLTSQIQRLYYLFFFIRQNSISQSFTSEDFRELVYFGVLIHFLFIFQFSVTAKIVSYILRYFIFWVFFVPLDICNYLTQLPWNTTFSLQTERKFFTHLASMLWMVLCFSVLNLNTFSVLYCVVGRSTKYTKQQWEGHLWGNSPQGRPGETESKRRRQTHGSDGKLEGGNEWITAGQRGLHMQASSSYCFAFLYIIVLFFEHFFSFFAHLRKKRKSWWN